MAVSPTHFLSPPTQLTQERGSGGWADPEDKRANVSATTFDVDVISKSIVDVATHADSELAVGPICVVRLWLSLELMMVQPSGNVERGGGQEEMIELPGGR
jgi:hypothetical protein